MTPRRASASTRVLVLDANERSALAVTRALGRAGLEVLTAGSTNTTLAGSSRYAAGSLVYPCPYRFPSEFAAQFPGLAGRAGAGVIIPCSEVTTYLLSRDRAELETAVSFLPDFAAFESLSDKAELFRRAEELGIPIPGTRRIEPGEDVTEAARNIEYPAVLKPFRSRVLTAQGWRLTNVRIVRSRAELHQVLEEDASFREFPWLLQEYVTGQAAGIFCFHAGGKATSFFAHRRLRERPPSGGVSVLSESVPAPARMCEIARRLLEVPGWRGPAMVEFKVDACGAPYLMEINPRLWGSLQLAVDAGINFPLMIYRSALEQSLDEGGEYVSGKRLRWLLGDLDRLYLILRDRKCGVREKAQALLQFANPGWGRTRYEVNRVGDLGPFWFELRNYRGK